MQQSDLLFPNQKPVPDILRTPETTHTPDIAEVREIYESDKRDSDALHMPDTTKTHEPDAADLPSPDMPERIHASNASERIFAAMKRLCEKAPRIHCLTNMVTMNDVANILLAIGGSAIMAQSNAEVEQITALCQATLINTGTPSDEKFFACCLAGAKANKLGHPVVLDPVGVGASIYRKENIGNLLLKIHPNLIRCNLEEALTLLALAGENLNENKADTDGCSECKDTPPKLILPETDEPLNAACELLHGGVESGADADISTRAKIAAQLAKTYQTTALISGSTDAVSNGYRTALITGGDKRITRITGSGCMLSAICAALLSTQKDSYQAALDASILWKQAAEYAGQKTDASSAGMGSFRQFLFDAATNLGCLKI